MIPLYEGFREVKDSLLNTTEASERIDAAAGMVSTAEDLLQLGSAVYFEGFLSAPGLNFLTAPGKDIEKMPAGTDRQGVVRALHTTAGNR